MAQFTASNLATAQLIADDQSKKAENRLKPAPVFSLLTSNGQFLYQNAETIRTREDRDADIYLMSRVRRAAGTARSHNHSGDRGDSFKVTPSFTTKSDKFSISLKQMDNNLFGFNETMAHELMNACKNVLEAKETQGAAWLRTYASQFSQSLRLGTAATFNAVNYSFEINAANTNRFYYLLKSALRQNYYNGPYDVIADNLMYVNAEDMIAQGSANDKNLQPQFMGLNIVESNEIADANYTNGMVFAMPEKSAGAINWIPQQNRIGAGDYNSYVGGYGSFDYMGYKFAVHGYSARADTSAANGNVQDVLMEFEVSLDTTFNTSPLSGANAGETNIFQAALI